MVFIDEDKYRNLSGIYKISNTKSGLSYIGQTQQKFIKRFFHHRFLLRKHKHDNKWLQASYDKYGEEAFTFSVVEVVFDFDLLNSLEIKYIAEEREKGHCCNLTDGGDGAKGMPMPEYQKRRLGDLNRRLNTGKRASKETKAKMSAMRKGKRRSQESIDKWRKTKNEFLLNGGSIAQSKLTAKEAAEIKEKLILGVTYKELAAEYNISNSNINAIRSNRSWNFVKVDGWDEYCKTHIHNYKTWQSRSAN